MKVTDEPITKNISNQPDIELRQFTQEEFDSFLRKILNRKAARLDEISPEVLKTREFDDILLRYNDAKHNQNTKDKLIKGCILPFIKKGDLRITKNYRGITLTSIVGYSPTHVESRQHSLERAAGDIDLHVNAEKTEHVL